MSTKTETAAQKVVRLEKKVERLERELIQARLELSSARPCYLCGKTTAEGCKADTHPYVCGGPEFVPYQA